MKVRLDAVPLGLDPVEVTRGAVEGAVIAVVVIVVVVVVIVVAQVVVATEAAPGIALLRQPHCRADIQ